MLLHIAILHCDVSSVYQRSCGIKKHTGNFVCISTRERCRQGNTGFLHWLGQTCGRFHGDRTYEFTFDCQLSKGDAEVFLLDRHKQQLLKLNRQFPTGRAELKGKSRCYLHWEFKNATGKCELNW